MTEDNPPKKKKSTQEGFEYFFKGENGVDLFRYHISM